MRAAPLLLVALLLAGCASADLAAGPAAADVDGTDTLVRYLEGQGFTLRPDGPSPAAAAPAAASRYLVPELASPAQLEVFEFEDEAAARQGLVRLRAEIRPRAHQEVFASGPLVVYARAVTYRTGLDQRLRRTLAAALGGPRGGA